ncbi:MAG TPA: 50S ribosomal protein L25 [Gemmataceae bacterium]|jgi:large subunit ribosomal protein L25|nr:50S ribosomal protein L25 [Gemmataceae bacterium]
MNESLVLVTRQREGRGTRLARRLRKQGLVPAVIYGHQEGTLPVALPADDLSKVIRQGVHVLDLQTDGTAQKVLIREVQWDHLGKELLHVDFARVGADERVVVTVPIEIKGTAPGISAGGILDQPIHSIAVECLVTSVPASVRVNVNELQLGAAIHVRDLVLPPDVKVMADPDAIVVHVTQKQLEEAPVAAPPVAEQTAEPEVIGRQKAAEEEAE